MVRSSRRIAAWSAGAVIAAAGIAGATSANGADSVARGLDCPGTFQVQHNDSIGKLKLPAGPYVISVKRMPCMDASSNFTRFLQRPAGDLPDGWRVFARRGKFVQRTQNKAFLVRPATTPAG